MERRSDYGELEGSVHLGEEIVDRIGCKKTRRLHHNFGNRQDKLEVEHIVHCGLSGGHEYSVVDYVDVVDDAAVVDVVDIAGVVAPAAVVDDTGAANPASTDATPQTEKGDQKAG